MSLSCGRSRHYSTDGKYVTVSSGKGDPKKDIMVDVFKDALVSIHLAKAVTVARCLSDIVRDALV